MHPFMLYTCDYVFFVMFVCFSVNKRKLQKPGRPGTTPFAAAIYVNDAAHMTPPAPASPSGTASSRALPPITIHYRRYGRHLALVTLADVLVSRTHARNHANAHTHAHIVHWGGKREKQQHWSDSLGLSQLDQPTCLLWTNFPFFTCHLLLSPLSVSSIPGSP